MFNASHNNKITKSTVTKIMNEHRITKHKLSGKNPDIQYP